MKQFKWLVVVAGVILLSGFAPRSGSCRRPLPWRQQVCQAMEQAILDATVRLVFHGWIEVENGFEVERIYGTISHATVIDGRLLLIQRADNGQWALPGGALEVGETAAAGAMREAYEETGVRCELVDLAGVWDSRLCGSTTRHHLYHFVYLAKPLNGSHPDAPVHPQETLGMGWFAEDDLPDGIDPGHVSRLPHLFAMWRGEARPYFDA